MQEPGGSLTKDRIACAEMRSLSVRVELQIQTEGSHVDVEECQFLVACFGFQPPTRKPCSSGHCRDDACIASHANTEIDC